jgi:hypothetical protein
MQESGSESQADIRETAAAGPPCPQKRTSLCVIGTSASCHKRKFCDLTDLMLE